MKTISVEITTEDVKQLLAKHLVIADKEKFAELIIGHLSKSSVSLEHIYKALIGIYPEFNYKEGDWVYVPLDALPVWRMDKEKTKALPKVMGNNIPCEITKVDTYQEACYDIDFTYIPKDSDVLTVEHYSIKESYIARKVENIEDLLDEMEELQINNEDIVS
jgi:hypothetical protein